MAWYLLSKVELQNDKRRVMKVVLWGVETNNKGAELMLYAILQDIERKWPDAIVYIPYSRCKQGLDYVKTSLDLRYTPYSKFVYKIRLGGILRHLRLPTDWLGLTNIVKDAEWFIDGSGFAFSDQWNIKNWRVGMWQMMLDKLNSHGCKIVFLPQAFGPVELPNTKRTLKLISDNANIIMPREQVSYNYLEKSGVVDMNKVSLYTDFTSLVDGVFPSKFEHLKNGICIIPNMRMIDKGTISFDDYVKLLTSILETARKSSRPVYLLNHEGKKDEMLAYKCKESIGNDIEVVTGLNALEVKGLIASAYLVVTSRFHGLASALNSCVPALATSWSHKYEELFKDYGLNNCVLPLDNIESAKQKVISFLGDDNQRIRDLLKNVLPGIKAQTRTMWNEIWKLK